MKTAFALLLFIAPVFAAEPASKAEKEVMATVDTWKQAMVKGDAAALGKLYHSDLTYEHSSGKTETKAESIEAATKPGAVAKSIEFKDPTVRVYGNTAIVKSVGDFTGATGTVSHLDVLMVFVKSPQGWQLVARQSTKIP
jgi:ketosteroid isomerase-like protein